MGGIATEDPSAPFRRRGDRITVRVLRIAAGVFPDRADQRVVSIRHPNRRRKHFIFVVVLERVEWFHRDGRSNRG
jgi:hypothetical protein